MKKQTASSSPIGQSICLYSRGIHEASHLISSFPLARGFACLLTFLIERMCNMEFVILTIHHSHLSLFLDYGEITTVKSILTIRYMHRMYSANIHSHCSPIPHPSLTDSLFLCPHLFSLCDGSHRCCGSRF